MYPLVKLLPIESFTFGPYVIDKKNSVVNFKYHVKFKFGFTKTFTDKLFLKDVLPNQWEKVPKEVLESTLQSLLLMLGINYYAAFPAKNILINDFSLTRIQAEFWNKLYLNGLGEFFYLVKFDFRNLISFPYSESLTVPTPTHLELPNRALLLNGAGKDSILSAEILKVSNTPFDFFAFTPTPAHKRIAQLVGVNTISVTRKRDPLINLILQGSYPSVSMFTFIAVLLAELIGYNSIVFSNERSADFGNLEYLGLPINHQWCKSTEAEKMINDYIQNFITQDIKTVSLLRKFSELEIVESFVKYPQYLHEFTSCNTYFWLPRFHQNLMKKNYWCCECPKCVFLFASFSAFLPKKDLVNIFGNNLYTKKKLLPLFKRILGIEGTKPLDCVGEPKEMILAMHYAQQGGEYADDLTMKIFTEHFPINYDFKALEEKVFTIVKEK